MDGDRPGRDSNTRLVTALAAMAKTAKVVALPDGEDPASWLATNGAGELSTLSAGAFDLSPAQCRHMREAIRNVRSPNREVDAPSAMRRAVLGIRP
jgi:DNA primase